MAGTKIKVSIDATAAQAKLAHAEQALADPRELLLQLGEYLRNSTQDRFGIATSPDGVPWKKLEPSYLRRKKHNKNKILQLDGHLKGNMTFQLDGADAVLVGSNQPYAAIHQFGGTIKKPARQSEVFFHRDKRTNAVGRRFVKRSKSNATQRVTIGAHEISIKARPYLGVSPKDRVEIVERTQEFMRKLLG